MPKNDSPPVEIPPPLLGITIEFPFSRSQSYEFAIREASKHSTYLKYGHERNAVHRVTYQKDEMIAATGLAECLSGWRVRRVYLDGEKIPWQSIFSYAWCFRAMSGSFRPEYYCFGYAHPERHLNIWGCIQSRLFLFPYADWYCWGRFIDDKGTWEYDKKRIRENLQKNLFRYRFCPALDSAFSDDMIRFLPDRVNPNENEDWRFIESYGTSLIARNMLFFPNEPIAPQPILRGVAPKGTAAIKEMTRNIKRRLPWI